MKICEKCGRSFDCLANTQETCWCFSFPKNLNIPKSYKDCLCPECLQAFVSDSNTTQSATEATLIDGEDFYLENGLMVFTSKYHLKRGYCCDSGCRHCPY